MRAVQTILCSTPSRYPAGVQKYQPLSSTEHGLNAEVERLMLEFPYCGENRQILYQNGVKVQRTRIRDSIHRVDHDGVNARKDSRLHGCFYSLIKGANYLWHAYIYIIYITSAILLQ